MDPIKLTIVGDGYVGRTSLLRTYNEHVFPERTMATVFEKCFHQIDIDGVNYTVEIWDTAGQPDYDKIRPICYPGTKCFILCYSIDSRCSFKNVERVWVPELRKHIPHAHIVLVGTKLDTRPNPLHDAANKSSSFVSTAEGLDMKERIKAARFIECSAMNQTNLETVFETALRCVINSSAVECVLF